MYKKWSAVALSSFTWHTQVEWPRAFRPCMTLSAVKTIDFSTFVTKWQIIFVRHLQKLRYPSKPPFTYVRTYVSWQERVHTYICRPSIHIAQRGILTWMFFAILLDRLWQGESYTATEQKMCMQYMDRYSQSTEIRIWLCNAPCTVLMHWNTPHTLSGVTIRPAALESHYVQRIRALVCVCRSSQEQSTSSRHTYILRLEATEAIIWNIPYVPTLYCYTSYYVVCELLAITLSAVHCTGG